VIVFNEEDPAQHPLVVTRRPIGTASAAPAASMSSVPRTGAHTLPVARAPLLRDACKTMSPLSALLLAAAVATPGPSGAHGPADSPPTIRRDVRPTADHCKARPRPRSGEHPRKVKNMPEGWTWPPSTAMKQAGARCLARLDVAGIAHDPARPARKVATPIHVPAMEIGDVALVSLKRKGPHTLDCHLADALAAVAPELRALGVRALHFRTLHEYRGVRRKGVSRRILSRHAVGLAVDVFEVAFEDGDVLRVKHHWRSPGRRLAAVAAVFERSPAFRTPLTPANDPHDHDDHLHLEAHMPLDP